MEPEVRDFLVEKNQDLIERKRIRRIFFNDLRKRGNYLYNFKINYTDIKKILPIPRPPGTGTVMSREKYVYWVFCLGTFCKKTFYRHLPKCSSNLIILLKY